MKAIILPRVPDNLSWLKMYADLTLKKKCKNLGIKSLKGNKMQTSADALEVRVRFFANLFNEKPSACAVLKNYISP